MKPFRHAFFIWGWPLLAQDNPLVLLDEPQPGWILIIRWS